MIIILSRQDDGSTFNVIEWLIAMRKKFVRIDADTDRTNFISFNSEKNELIVSQDGKAINLMMATSIWHRRSGISNRSLRCDTKEFNKRIFLDDADHRPHIESEAKVLFRFIHFLLEKRCILLGNDEKSELNKMQVILLAMECDLKVPKSYIVTNKLDLKNVIENNESPVVTKALGNGVYRITKEYGFYSFTERLTEKNTKQLPDEFFPSLLQEEIKKKYELRVFYIKEQFYAMAIFSQNDKTTKVDFRKYNHEKPNRSVPYLLPGSIKQKLIKLFGLIGLNTGSIDLIVDHNGDYVFLEINPVGQFSMTSLPCNYYLEKKIAQTL
jgi:ATP-GRASP peptide maturase of grasp-with-spasm system